MAGKENRRWTAQRRMELRVYICRTHVSPCARPSEKFTVVVVALCYDLSVSIKSEKSFVSVKHSACLCVAFREVGVYLTCTLCE